MIKIIGIDLDGTLLDDNKQISKANCIAINNASKKKIKVVLITGRPLANNTIEFYKQLGIYTNNEYFIAYNGAVIYNIYTKKILFKNILRSKDIKEIDHYFSKYDETYSRYIHSDEIVYYRNINEYAQLENKFNDIEMKELDFAQENKCAYKYMIASDPEKIQKVFDDIPQYLKEKYHIFISMPCFIEIVNKEIDKYVALEYLRKYLKYEEDTIMAIGDSMNDYYMIKNAFFGVAMENSIQEVKDVAKYITKSNNESGVAMAIEHAFVNVIDE